MLQLDQNACSLSVTPHGRLVLLKTAGAEGAVDPALAERISRAFAGDTAQGLLYLATRELQTPLPPPFAFARGFATAYLTRLCHQPTADTGPPPPLDPLPDDELEAMVSAAPPMMGGEYLNIEALSAWWRELDAHVRHGIEAAGGNAQAYLRELSPLWRLVGRVTFHLAENKRDPEHPFAFLATYVHRLSEQARLQHQPLSAALQEYAGAKNRSALLSLLTPIQRAAERSQLVRDLVDSGDVYHPLAWTPAQALRLLRDIPLLEESGLVVRVADWWKAAHPPRPVVSVKLGDQLKSKVGADAILDFSVGVALEGEPLSAEEIQMLLQSSGGLVSLKGKWVEIDRDKLSEALKHWKSIERDARGGGLTFFEGMRLLAGVPIGQDTAASLPPEQRQWVGITAGAVLERTLRELRAAVEGDGAAVAPPGLIASLRPYQQAGVNWLRFVTGLGLGACLADDMGLGKTIQVLSLLLFERATRGAADHRPPSLLIVPASLIANWKAEIARFAPALSVTVEHPSERAALSDEQPAEHDLIITTYGMLGRLDELRRRRWNLVILDEAQAIKNPGTRQTRAVKELSAAARIALTGTPVENRLGDLWSIFDFLNPGLLGGAKAFARFAKEMESTVEAGGGAGGRYAPLRSLVRPYILRRLKTDKRVIADLPEKTEITAFCGLSRVQAALYEQAVRDLDQQLRSIQDQGIQRRGIVLACLMRLKQISNHPAQATGDGRYDPQVSGKFQRLADLCGELSERQEKVLVFTQFREIAAPLAEFLAGIFGRPGLVLHGQVPVARRRALVDQFQRDDGPPFFVLSLKAGGTGLNLTAASHVIHFDRWWNPAVENQATDRAFRIGQRRNVFVHKFVCRGTVEERIDQMIAEKNAMSRDLLDAERGGEMLLTEMSDEQLMRFVALDITKATGA